MRRNPQTTHVLFAALSALVLLGLGGCGSGESPQTTTGNPRPPGPPIRDLAGHRLPIETYLFSNTELGDLYRARLVLASSCLKRFGLTASKEFTGSARRMSGDRSAVVNPPRRYGITDPGAAGLYGYHLDPAAAAELSAPPDEPELSLETDTVLTGETADGSEARVTAAGQPIPDGGCFGEAARHLGFQPREFGDHPLALQVNLDSYHRTRADPRVVRAFRAWSDCMRREGLSFDDPMTAPGDSAEFRGAQATEAERDIAAADVGCKAAAGLVGVWFTVEQEYQERRIRESAPEFRRIEQELRQQRSRAEQVLERMT
jgi:hypothetical protein